jgi:hypothetical protein
VRAVAGFLTVILILFGTGCRAAADSDVGFSRGDSPQRVAEPKGPAKSQEGSTSQRIGEMWIAINYSRPVARGRELFGSLVPFGEPWTPGANRATKVHLTGDVAVNGKRLPASVYSIWMIPRRDQWTVIFNSVAEVDHQPYPGPATDVLRVNAAPSRGAHIETLTFYFPVVDGYQAELRMHWGEYYVPLRIEALTSQSK